MITIDLRSLHNNQFSGVEFFTTNVVERLIGGDANNRYKLFYNGYQKKQFPEFAFINSEYQQTRYPNKLLNLSMKFFGLPKLNRLTGESQLFMPNPNVVALDKNVDLTLVVHDLSPLILPELYSVKSRLWHNMVNIKKLCLRANKIIAVSNYTKQTLEEVCKVDSSKIFVAPLGIDHQKYNLNLGASYLREIRNKYLLPQKFILFLATVEPRKNLQRVIEAFNSLEQDVDLVIAGKPGWKYQPAFAAIEQSRKKARITYLNYVPESDKPGLLALAKLLVWPSLFEGFGLPVLEAMAVGTPVVTSNVSSLPEVVQDSAVMVDPYNVVDIASAIHNTLNSAGLKQQLIAKGLERVESFTWDKTVDIIKRVLHQ